MIQLLRPEFSRKCEKLFEGHKSRHDEEVSDILEEYAEMLCEAQADLLAQNKAKTRMDKHLNDVYFSLSSPMLMLLTVGSQVHLKRRPSLIG